MKHRRTFNAALLLSALLFVSPGAVRAQDEAADSQPPNFGHYVGSVFLSLFHVPYKAVMCVSGQVLGGAAYIMTAGVPGNYSGETNGEDIGTIAAASCAAPWIISPREISKDYRADLEPIDYNE